MDIPSTFYKQYLERLLEYAEILEQALLDYLEGFFEWQDEEAVKLPEEEQADFYEYFGEDEWTISELFPNILRSTLFSTCYSVLEHELVRLCRQLSHLKGLSQTYEDFKFRGSEIQKARQYLKQVAGIPLQDDTAQWNEVADWTRMRNVLVHNDGRPVGSKYEHEVRQYIARTQSLSFDYSGRMKISAPFYKHVTVSIQRLLDEVHELASK